MGIDTRPNLSSSKFEQFAGEILNLSGCTQIFGQFDIESGATLSICNNFGQGKVLVSDSQGNATWGFTVTGYTNGLCKYDSQNVCLGGILVNNTTIDIDTYDFKLCSAENPNRSIYLDQQNNELKLCWSDAANTCCSSISINPTSVELGSYYDGGGCSANICVAHDDNKIYLGSAGSIRTYHDENGLWYSGDYSSGATNRWLTDKAYVDNKVTITGVTNGLCVNDNMNVVLGGTLTGNTTIDLNSYNLTLDDGYLILTNLTGSTKRIVEANIDGSLSANTPIITGKITNATIISLLVDEDNWSVNGVYVGIEITGTYEGQYYANNDYYFFAYDDNDWLRMIRG